MTLDLNLPETQGVSLRPRIVVLGVGGAGGNAVNNMIRSNLSGVEFVVANTDAQALELSLADSKMQLGVETTRGLGAGSYPEVGRESAEEAKEELERLLDGANMLFVTAGMGGGTGTGAAPFIAEMAKERGILTVAVVTKPFDFEGKHRMKMANKGIANLRNFVDTLIIIPNQNLFRIANTTTTVEAAFKAADDVLHAGVRGITDLITMPGLINLDFADVKTIMTKMGKAMMGTGEAEGDERSIMAAESAISNPLLDDVSINGAKGVIINITGGTDMTLFEVEEITKHINGAVDEDANIIVGSAFNEDMYGKLRVSVVATGIEDDFDPTELFEEEQEEIATEEETSKSNSRVGYRYKGGVSSDDKEVRESTLFSFNSGYQAPKEEAVEQPMPKKKRRSFIPTNPVDPEIGNEPISFKLNRTEDEKELGVDLGPDTDLFSNSKLKKQNFSSREDEETQIKEEKISPDEDLNKSREGFRTLKDDLDNDNRDVKRASLNPGVGNITSNNNDRMAGVPQSSVRNVEQQHKAKKSSFFNKLFNKSKSEDERNDFRLNKIDNGNDIKISDTAYYNNNDVDSEILEVPAYLRKKKQ